MGNLVFKPAAGGGNKVIFQNQDGSVDAITIEGTGATTLPGNSTVGGTLGVTGAATVGGTFDVTGVTTLVDSAVTGNSTVGGTLGVTGVTTLTGGVTGTTTFADNITLSGTANALGTVTSGVVPSSLVTGKRLVQHQYGYKGASVDYVVSSESSNTMSGAPFTVMTPEFDTTSTTSTIWHIASGIGLNNETGAYWNASMKFWVSYNSGTTWTSAMVGHANAGTYLAYSSTGNPDAYTFLTMDIYTSLTASNTTTKIGCAMYSYEGDSTRWNLTEGGGAFLSASQYCIP